MQLPLSKDISNNSLSQVFDFISGALSLHKADVFRVRAYDNAGATIQLLDKPWYEYVDNKEDLTKIPGIGQAISDKLVELRSTGTIKAFEKYVKDIPTGVWGLNLVHGIGVKKAYTIATNYRLSSEESALQETLKLAKDNKLQNLPGFGEKSEQVIIKSIQNHTSNKGRMTLAFAQEVAQDLISKLKKSKAIRKVEVLGSIRRQADTIGDIDLGIATSDIKSASKFIKELDNVKTVVVAGEGLIRIKLLNDLQVDIKVSPEDEWGSFIQHFTGSKNHNIKLREWALSQNKSLSEHGIKYLDTNKMKKFSSEKAFYRDLGLELIPPAERIGGNEIEKAKIN